ncbi:MAG: hypothetical protein QXU50_06520 [Candidatus Korarchaeum sp.]
MIMRERNISLLSFVLKELRIPAANLLENFDSRLRIQKVIYLLKTAGYPFEYDFKLYMRGPYSTELADDYMELARRGDQEIENLANEVSDDDLRRTLEVLRGIDNETLEVASSLHLLILEYRRWGIEEMSRIVDHLKSIKTWVSDEHVAKGLEILKVLGVADLPP